MRFRAAMLAAAFMAIPAFAESESSKGLAIHEWGTFTSLQNEQGKAIGGINADDEPVPSFVHRMTWGLVGGDSAYLSKGIPRSLPSVTMRLETPVLYFHPGKDVKLPIKVDVQAQFRSGWLTEFYPDAAVSTEHFATPGAYKAGPLTPASLGKLTWSNLTVGSGQVGPETKAKVWLTPRQVDAAGVATDKESEKYLFYRGVANLDAPIKVVRDSEQLHVMSQLDPKQINGEIRIGHAWLADIKGDGTCAIRSLPPMTIIPGSSQEVASMPATFDSTSYGSLDELRVEMHAALMADGLYDDEATALLNTWEVSYFKSPGLRLFFMVPQNWTDHYLPLKIDGHGTEISTIKRAMVGRLELVTPHQRDLLRVLAKPVTPNNVESRQQYSKAYADLGRFRDALIHEDSARTSPPKPASN
jgi:hypothetical protein